MQERVPWEEGRRDQKSILRGLSIPGESFGKEMQCTSATKASFCCSYFLHDSGFLSIRPPCTLFFFDSLFVREKNPHCTFPPERSYSKTTSMETKTCSWCPKSLATRKTPKSNLIRSVPADAFNKLHGSDAIEWESWTGREREYIGWDFHLRGIKTRPK
jgi:hypothetical protein